MYKLKCEIYPYAAKYLAPRYHISAHFFSKIRKQKIKEFGGRYCEACNQLVEKAELHEGFTITNNCYYFEGFFLLCVPCHDALHFEKVGEHINDIQYFQSYWTFDEEFFPSRMSKYSIYKNSIEFMNHKKLVSDNTFNFTMSNVVTANYEKVADYGLSPDSIFKSFIKNYNHYDCRLRYMYFENFKNPNSGSYKFDELIKNYEHVNRYTSVLLSEYVKHIIFYIQYNILSENWKVEQSSEKKEALIKAYSIIMKEEDEARNKKKSPIRSSNDKLFNNDEKLYKAYSFFITTKKKEEYIKYVEYHKLLFGIANDKNREKLREHYVLDLITKERYQTILKQWDSF